MYIDDEIFNQIKNINNYGELDVTIQGWEALSIVYFIGTLYRETFLFLNIRETKRIFKVEIKEVYEYFDSNIPNTIIEFMNIFLKDYLQWETENFDTEWKQQYKNEFSKFKKQKEE